MIDYKILKEKLRSECEFQLPDSLLDKFISLGKPVRLQANDYIIAPDTIDKSVWITASGVVKVGYFDGKKERVQGFCGAGTIILSPMGFLIGKPSFCYFQTCTDSDMLRISRKDFDALIAESHDFTRWMFLITVGQFCAFELKSQMLSQGDSYSNYKQLMKRQMILDRDGFDPNRPSLLSIISSKDLASYLGITQSYLSNIRKAILDEERGNV